MIGVCFFGDADCGRDELRGRVEWRASTELRVEEEDDDAAELEREKRAMIVFLAGAAGGSSKMELIAEVSGGGTLFRKSMSDSSTRFGGPLGRVNSSSSSSSSLYSIA